MLSTRESTVLQELQEAACAPYSAPPASHWVPAAHRQSADVSGPLALAVGGAHQVWPDGEDGGKEVPSRNCRGGSTLVKLLHCCFKWLCCSLSEQEVLSCMEWFEGCSLAQCSWWWLPQCWGTGYLDLRPYNACHPSHPITEGSIVVRASGWHSGGPGLIPGYFSQKVLSICWSDECLSIYFLKSLILQGIRNTLGKGKNKAKYTNPPHLWS